MNTSKKNYVRPVIRVVNIDIENGYSLSGNRPRTLVMGAEGMTDGGYQEDINPLDNGDHMTEGIQPGPTEFF